jgi:hypothetical protein
MDNNNFQRIGSVSNTQAGNDFEAAARAFFAQHVTIAGPSHKMRPSSPARLYEPTMPLPR